MGAVKRREQLKKINERQQAAAMAATERASGFMYAYTCAIVSKQFYTHSFCQPRPKSTYTVLEPTRFFSLAPFFHRLPLPV